MEAGALFEFICPECEKGTVRTTRIHNYKTKIKGYPFTVDEALIGVCDECEAQSFAPEETQRWDELFSHSLQARHAFLTPEEITQIRKALGLSMEDFARLIGSTRQSVSMWEKESRTTPPVRTADLLMKLVRQSLSGAPVDMLPFLLDEAKKWGVVIELRRPQRQNERTIFRRSSNLPIPREQMEKKIMKAFEETRDEDENETMSNREIWMARLEAVKGKYEQLEHVRAAIAPAFLKKVQETIESEAATTQNLKLPVLFFLLYRRDIKDLRPLDRFLGHLRKSKERRHQKEFGKLKSRLQEKTDYRQAAGALFEMEILIRLLEKSPKGSIGLYPQIRNKNFPEASIILGEKTVYFEATIRSQAEKQERALEIGHTASSVVVCTSDPYNDARLIIGKIEEKRKQLGPVIS